MNKFPINLTKTSRIIHVSQSRFFLLCSCDSILAYPSISNRNSNNIVTFESTEYILNINKEVEKPHTNYNIYEITKLFQEFKLVLVYVCLFFNILFCHVEIYTSVGVDIFVLKTQIEEHGV